MLTIDNVISEIAKKTQIDKETVEIICKHPFLCTVNMMKDEQDYHQILFNQLFKFKLKTRFNKDKTKKYSSK